MDILEKIENVLNEDIGSEVMEFLRNNEDIKTEEDLEAVVMGYEDRNPAAAQWLEANFEQVAEKLGIELY